MTWPLNFGVIFALGITQQEVKIPHKSNRGRGSAISWISFLTYAMVDTWEASTMLDLTELRRRYETVRVTEDSKDKIIEACFGTQNCGPDLTN